MRNRRLNLLLLAGSIGLLSGCGTQTQSKPENVVQETKELPADSEEELPQEDTSYHISLAFAGDINFSDDWSTMEYYNQQENGISDCIDPYLITQMNEADVMWINNEFAYSDRGTPMAGKAYTFCAKPEHVSILQELGVDVAGLANNHIYDYGEDAFLDTLDTLSHAGIAYSGAGRNLEEAMAPAIMEVDGKKIAYVAATRAEKNIMTPEADEDSAGVLRCYDTTLLKEAIGEAKKAADYVVVLVHWGTEYSTTLEDVQTTTGKEYIDAGADMVIGAYSHCLQGMEFYQGKPIVYSLGNYWFNEKTLRTELLEIEISGEDQESQMQVKIIPAMQENHVTSYIEDGQEQREFYDYMEEISVNVSIDDNGMVTENTEE